MIHIFEPHGDDALISCWPVLIADNSSDPRDQIAVITFGHSRPSYSLMRYFPNVCTAGNYDCYEIHMKYRAAFKTEYDKWAKLPSAFGHIFHGSIPTTPYEWQQEITALVNRELWKESYQETVQSVSSHLAYNTRLGDLILSPVGLLHPYHICLASAVEDCRRNFPHLHFGTYVDYPYGSAKWVQQIIDTHPFGIRSRSRSSVDGPSIVEVSVPGDPYEHLKEQILKDVYPTELGLLRFTRDEVLKPVYHFYLPPKYFEIVSAAKDWKPHQSTLDRYNLKLDGSSL